MESISGGMIPKINTCLDAVNNGVTGVVIVDGRKPHSILFEIFSDKGAGTLDQKMKELKKLKYIILDMDGCVISKIFKNFIWSSISKRMTNFISKKLEY